MHSQKDSVTRWRCQTRDCEAFLCIDGSQSIVKEVEHNHPAVKQKSERLLFMNKIKEKAQTTNEDINSIIFNETINATTEIINSVPRLKSIKDNITKERNKLISAPATDFEDIPIELRLDHTKHQFYRFDSGLNMQNRFIIFSSQFKAKYVEESTVWIIDATFRTAPSGFLQILTIHGLFLGKAYPIIYVLMQNKNEASYIAVFRKISEIFNLKVKIAITDLEKALINGLNCLVSLEQKFICLFHFGQCLWRKIQSLHFMIRYKHDIDFYDCINMFLSLAFVPVEDVINTYKRIVTFANEKSIANMKEIIEYIERMFVGCFDINGDLVQSPIYPIDTWNAYKRILNNIPRTTNAVEGWHRSFNQHNVVAHPNIARLINKMKDQEELDRVRILQSMFGNFELMSKNYKKEHKLLVCIENYKYFAPLEYLQAVYKNHKWVFDD